MMKELKLTLEQQNVLKAVKSQKVLKLKAYAGCGKTTTLLEIVKSYPGKKFLLLAFNKSVAEEIRKKKTKFKLKNLSVYTLHGLAYNYLFIKGKGYKGAKPKLLTVNERDIANDIYENLGSLMLETFGYDEITSGSVYFLYKVFSAVLSSPYLPPFTIDKVKKAVSLYEETNKLFWFYTRDKNNEEDIEKVEKITEAVNQLWKETLRSILSDIEETDEGVIRYSHEAYIKYFQILLESKRVNLKGFDFVLVDEAQDINGVNIGIINALQKQGLKVVIVGDPHQNIYNWRGAINSFNYYKKWKELPLSISFRFANSEIVDFANVIIQKVKGEQIPLKNLNDDNNLPKKATIGLISRTNAGLIDFLFKLKEYEEYENPADLTPFEEIQEAIKTNFKKGVKFKLLRTIREIFYPIDIMIQVKEALKSDNKSKIDYLLPKYLAEDIKRFNSLEELIPYFENINEYELRMATKTILKYGAKELKALKSWLYEKLEMGEVKEKKGKANVVLTTIHTAKGLEWDYVILNDDIVPISLNLFLTALETLEEDLSLRKYREVVKELIDGIRNFRYRKLTEEINLKYVAITRAKYLLDIQNTEFERELRELKEIKSDNELIEYFTDLISEYYKEKVKEEELFGF